MPGSTKLIYQDGIVVGNIKDKAHLRNPVSRLLVSRFDAAFFFDLIDVRQPMSLNEVGCAQDRITRVLARRYKVPLRASGLSKDLIAPLQDEDLPNVEFLQRSIHGLKPGENHADMVICCEEMEHLEFPTQVLAVLRELNANHYLLSVPREPIWRLMNIARGRYLASFGNTPGHICHWSGRGFIRFLTQNGFTPTSVRRPPTLTDGAGEAYLLNLEH